jgi:NAD(P)-dependent dehydrogenase (short-subunit alcohol dehydrogenase family)
MGKLDGKVALITGGSRGIGFAIAKEIVTEGGRVLITGREQATLDSAGLKLGDCASTFAGDAADREKARECVGQAIAKFGRIDILVNNAALQRQSGPTISMPIEDCEATYAVNVFAPLFWAQEVWKASMREHGGAVLNVSSLGAFALYPNMGAYHSSKAALNHLTRILAAEMGPGVRVNAVAPGIIRTEMSSEAWENREERFTRRMPLGRLGEPEDVARSVLFLVCDESSWITGETLVIDGGSIVQGARMPTR